MIDSRTTNRAMISVIEKARGRSESRPSARLLSVALMAVFFVALMGALASGATMYRSAVESQEVANALHLQAGLLTNVVRGNDAVSAVSETEGPEGPALVLTRRLRSNSYETRIYHYQGTIVEEFAVAGRPFDPESATPVVDSRTFSFEAGEDLVSFTTDLGTFVIALRSDESLNQSPVPQGQQVAAAVETIIDEGGMS